MLDEALTGLDQDTEREVVAALRRLTHGRTTFVITHDLQAAADADRVVTLEGGVVVSDVARQPAPVRRARPREVSRAPAG